MKPFCINNGLLEEVLLLMVVKICMNWHTLWPQPQWVYDGENR